MSVFSPAILDLAANGRINLDDPDEAAAAAVLSEVDAILTSAMTAGEKLAALGLSARNTAAVTL